jgi:hypothetical protein
MRYLRLYADHAGESHFEDVTVDLRPVEYVPGKPLIDLSSAQTAAGVLFGRVSAGWWGDAHPSPRRQLVVTLAGEADMTASDGEVRRLSPGIACLIEDTTGKGHSTQVVGAGDWSVVVVALA